MENVNFDTANVDILKNASRLDDNVWSEVLSIVANKNTNLTYDLAQAYNGSVTAQVCKRNKLPVYDCKYLGNNDGDKVARLTKLFSKFKVSCDNAYSVTGHAYARELRSLTIVYLLKLVGIDENATLRRSPAGNPYDVNIKDIGGALPFYLRLNRFDVHCCNPILSVQDVHRCSNTRRYLCQNATKFSLATERSRKVISDLLSDRQSVQCKLPGQYCNIKAPYAFFVHSTCDMTIEEFTMCLEACECQTAYAVFHCDLKIFTDTRGYLEGIDCHFTKYQDSNGVKRVRFDFSNDPHISYDHRMDTFVALVRHNYLMSADGCTRWTIERTWFEESTMIIKIERVMTNQLPKQRLTWCMPFKDVNDSQMVLCWQYHTVPTPEEGFHVTPAMVRVSNRMLSLSINYARNLNKGNQFTLQNLTPAMAAFNSRVIINGAEIGNKDMLDTNQLRLLTTAVYLMVYVSNWEDIQLITELIKEEAELRDYYQSGLVHRILRKITFQVNSKASLSCDELHPLTRSLTPTSDLEAPDSEGRIGFLAKLIKPIIKWTRTVRRHPIGVLPLPQFFSMEELMPAYYTVIQEYTLPYLNMPDYGSVVNSNAVLTECIENTFVEDTVNFSRPPTPLYDAACSSEKLVVEPVLGDGLCFYRAIKTDLDLPYSVLEMRNRLKDSAELSKFPLSQKESMQTRLSVPYQGNIVPREGWATCDIINLTAMHYKISICVHDDKNNKITRYNPGAGIVVHLSKTPDHFSLLVPDSNISDLNVPITLTFSDSSSREPAVRANYNVLMERVLATDRSTGRPIPGRIHLKYSKCSLTYHELCYTKWFDYESSYALILSEFFKLKTLEPSMVLDIEQLNKSSLQFYSMTMGCPVTCVFTVGCKAKGKSNLSIKIDGDVRTFWTGDSIQDTFDLISINPCEYSERLMTLDYEKYDSHLYGQIGSIRWLRTGGNLLIAVPVIMTSYCKALISVLRMSFQKMEIFRPNFVPPHCPWSLLYCSNYLNSRIELNEIWEVPMVSEWGEYHDNGFDFVVSEVENLALTRIVKAVDLLIKTENKEETCPGIHKTRYNKIREKIMPYSEEEVFGFDELVEYEIIPPVITESITERALDSTFVKKFGKEVHDLSDVEFFDSVWNHYIAMVVRETVAKIARSLGKTNVRMNDRTLEDLLVLLSNPNTVEYRFLVVLLHNYQETKSFRFKRWIKPVDVMRGYRINICDLYTEHFRSKFRLSLRSVKTKTFWSSVMTSVMLKDTANIRQNYSDAVERIVTADVATTTRSNIFNREGTYNGSDLETLKIIENNTNNIVKEMKEAHMEYLESKREVVDPNTGGISFDICKDDLKCNSTEPADIEKFERSVVGHCDPMVSTLPFTDWATVIMTEYLNYERTIVEAVTSRCLDMISLIEKTPQQLWSNNLMAGYDKPYLFLNGKRVVGAFAVTLTNRWLFVRKNKTTDPTFVKLNVDEFKTLISNNEIVFTYEDMGIFTSRDIFLNLMEMALPPFQPGHYGLIQAAAGCGKTHDIINTVKHLDNFMVLTSTTEGKDDLKHRLSLALNDDQTELPVFTIDSILMRPRKAKYLFIDEALMQHPGKIFYAFAVVEPEVARCYGDRLQIPFIDRSHTRMVKHADASAFLRLVKVLNISYRMPRDVAAVLRPYYVKAEMEAGLPAIGLKSVSKAPIPSMSYYHVDAFNQKPKANTKYLTFTQGEKSDLAAKGFDVSTVHEFQGKESDRVVLVRTNRQDGVVNSSLYHMVTAVTRHKYSLEYYNVGPSDLTSDLIVESTRLTSAQLEAVQIDTNTGGADGIYIFSQPSPISTAAGVDNAVLRSGIIILKHSEHYYSNGRNLAAPFNYMSGQSLRENVFIRKMVSGKRVSFDPKDFPRVSSETVTKILRDMGARVLQANNFGEVCQQVCSMQQVHGIQSIVEYDFVPILTTKDYVDEPKHNVLDIRGGCIQDIQTMLDAFTPTYTDQSYDDYLVHNTDFAIGGASLTLDLGTKPIHMPRYQCLRPVLKTVAYPKQHPTVRNSLLAMSKRNLLVPQQRVPVSTSMLALRMVNNIVSITNGLFTAPIDVSSTATQNWLNRQPTPVKNLIHAETSLDNMPVSRYKYVIKDVPKQDNTMAAVAEYPTPQSITFSEKNVNVVFCVIWMQVRDRLVQSLKPHFRIFTQMTEEQLTEHMDKYFPSNLKSMYVPYEIDMKKYDKSQQDSVLAMECLILRRFKVPEWLIDVWRQSHVRSTIVDMVCKINLVIYNQRRTGDAATFIGNTMCLIGMLLDVFPIGNIRFAVFAGDDSLIFSDKELDLDLDKLPMLYNMEVKLFRFKHYMFCSKFLVCVNNKWYLVPDPLKRATKLGRTDLKNFTHLDCYWESFRDSCKLYGDPLIMSEVEKAVHERYKITAPVVPACLAMHTLANSDYFRTLFYTLPEDELNPDTVNISNDR